MGHATDSVLITSDWDTGLYWTNFTYIRNNDNSNNNVHDPADLVDGLLGHICRCGWKRCKLKTNVFPLMVH